jgi:hypothetical protein
MFPLQVSASASSADAIDQTLAAKVAPVWSSPFVVGGKGNTLANSPSVGGDSSGTGVSMQTLMIIGAAASLLGLVLILRK